MRTSSKSVETVPCLGRFQIPMRGNEQEETDYTYQVEDVSNPHEG